MKVLVTGASGFLGSYVVRSLLERGYDVVGTYRTPGKDRVLLELGVKTAVRMDLLDPQSVRQAVRGVDAVIHLAAYYTFVGRKDMYRKVNVEGTKLLAEAALKSGAGRFIYCSSTEAMGPVDNPPADESTPPNPQFEYGRSKLEAERVVASMGSAGLKYTIIRPSGLYGPGNLDDISYWFITSFARGGIYSKFMVGGGLNLIQFVHARDAARGFLLALEKSDVSTGQTYIVSEDRAYTYVEVYRILRELIGRDPPKHSIPPWLAKTLLTFAEIYDRLRGGENFLYRRVVVDAVTKHRAYSIRKAMRELNYYPTYDLRSGLRETIEWYRSIGEIP
ncbi:MAG: NAD-dependent epimerase/dehydratase family protein [Sulfolobales archaeon]|nr:NAD-dependent epimerase/dehydratase family protein [Sulfolobales archaeon]MCX8209057.1 NAD-dependent epimerase/dehydratase family protein [Sulfolobales archaeon]MDW8009979.1 NAD-dependent epimerase/dehydratase family protein [Sulfolobales archaeon]